MRQNPHAIASEKRSSERCIPDSIEIELKVFPMGTGESSSDLLSLLQGIAAGTQSVEHVYEMLSSERSDSVGLTASGDVRIDFDREARCGFPEVIYGPGKSLESVVQGAERLFSRNQNVLVTRCSPEQLNALKEAFPQIVTNTVARTARFNHSAPMIGKVVVVSAGTSDRPVAEEALETLRWMNVNTELLLDVGVAGPQRFLQEKHRLDAADAVVVVAGMEGALPSVVGGWVRCPVIGVPTNVGYGASLGGFSALLSMLNSCASNVAVVNIDAGFKAGYVAGMIANSRSQSSHAG